MIKIKLNLYSRDNFTEYNIYNVNIPSEISKRS